MNKLISLAIVGILAILKLVLTGVCLAVGFNLGSHIYNKARLRAYRSKGGERVRIGSEREEVVF
jgi:hypothetical protein